MTLNSHMEDLMPPGAILGGQFLPARSISSRWRTVQADSKPKHIKALTRKSRNRPSSRISDAAVTSVHNFAEKQLRGPRRAMRLISQLLRHDTSVPVLRKKLRSRDWVVYAKPPFAGLERVLAYLGSLSAGGSPRLECLLCSRPVVPGSAWPYRFSS